MMVSLNFGLNGLLLLAIGCLEVTYPPGAHAQSQEPPPPADYPSQELSTWQHATEEQAEAKLRSLRGCVLCVQIPVEVELFEEGVPVIIAPWPEETVSQFLEEMYSSLDAGSLTALQKWVAPDAWHSVHSTDANGTVVEHEWKGLEEIQTAVQGWFDNRANMTEPIRYEIVKYKFPMLVVRVYVTEEVVGKSYGTVLYTLEGDKMSSGCAIWSSGTPEDAPLDKFPDVMNVIEDLQQHMSNNDTSKVASYFSEDLMWMVIHRFNTTSQEFPMRGMSRGALLDMVHDILQIPSLQSPSEVKLSVVAFQWPGVIVEGNITCSGDPDTVIADVLAAYTMREVDGQITIYKLAEVIDWKNSTGDEVMTALNGIDEEDDGGKNAEDNGGSEPASSGVYTNEPWSEDTVKDFLKAWYTAGDAGSLEALQKYMAPDGWFFSVNECSDGNTTLTKYHELAEIEESTLFDTNNTVTQYDISHYSFPTIVVNLTLTLENGDLRVGYQTFLLNGDKVKSVTLVLSAGARTDASDDVPPQVNQALLEFSSSMERKDIDAVRQYLSDDITWIIVNRFSKTQKEFLTSGTSSAELFGFMKTFFELSPVQEGIESKFSVLSYQWPGIVVKGQLRSASDPDNIVAECVETLIMTVGEDGQLKFDTMTSAVDWKNITMADLGPVTA
eukprot:GHVQ01034221.1.p1 GENE.GHVQ01034221.1~~GHVQ01034221.1.p1  ORF type:complete len:669 (+),score=70.25 GHVQ01034221.1:148-2154(+)